LTSQPPISRLAGIEVLLFPENEARLAEIAATNAINADLLAQEVFTRYLEDGSNFSAAVNAGLAAPDRGQLIAIMMTRSESEASV
jgi:hypothetical protein